MPKVVVVTDSASSLSPEVALRHGIVIVPLQVVIGSECYDDGIDPEASADKVADALRHKVPVSTSRPSPAVVEKAYRVAAATGAEEIVAVHLSAALSATYDSAVQAAKRSPVPVQVLDTRLIGAGAGNAALVAARVAARGGSAGEAVAAAAAVAARTHTLFYVDSLEYLRRGGRVGAASAMVGSALAVKPILHLHDGLVEALDKVRTSSKALARLEDLVAARVGEEPVRLVVNHLANPVAAERLAARLGQRLAPLLGQRAVEVAELSAVIGAHVGPGAVGVVVMPA